MTLYIATINDYGYGDCQHAIIRAESKEQALEIIREENHRIENGIEDITILDNYGTLTKGIVRII